MPDHPAQHALLIALYDAIDAARDLLHTEKEISDDLMQDLPGMTWSVELVENLVDSVTLSNKQIKACRKQSEQRRREVRAREVAEGIDEIEAVKPMVSVSTAKKHYWEAD